MKIPGSIVLLAVCAARLTSQAPAPQLATVVQPLRMPWEVCRTTAHEVLQNQRYTAFLPNGNGWTASARGTSVSITCVPQNLRTIVVIVAGGGQMVREATR